MAADNETMIRELWAAFDRRDVEELVAFAPSTTGCTTTWRSGRPSRHLATAAAS